MSHRKDICKASTKESRVESVEVCKDTQISERISWGD